MATTKSSVKEAPSKTASKKSTSSKASDSESKSKSADSKTAASKASSSRSSAAKANPGRKTSNSRSSSSTTTDHEEIKKWAEARGGKPSTVVGTGKGNDSGILRFDFPGYSGKDSLEEISWEDFFKKFDESNLEFLYQDKTSTGKQSRFNKFVSKS